MMSFKWNMIVSYGLSNAVSGLEVHHSSAMLIESDEDDSI